MAKYEENPLEAFTQIQGRAALAWIDGDNGRELNLARVTDSPLCVAQTPKGSTVFASTKPLLEAAMKEAGLKIEWIAEMNEYEYMKIRNGSIMEYTDFKPTWVKDLEKKEDEEWLLWEKENSLFNEHGWLRSVM
jgi:hypothetical protein